MVTLRQLMVGTQKLHPKAIEWAPDLNNSPMLAFEIQEFKGLNSIVIRSQQRMSGRWPKGERPTSKRGIYNQVMRFTGTKEETIGHGKLSAAKDKCSINCGCFTGDTKVILTNGTTATFKELVGKEFFVYSLNDKNEVVISDAVQCELKEKNAELVEIELDNGFKIKSTLDHLFKLKTGEYKQAKDLKENDSLAALYRRYSGEYKQDTLKGYELIRGPINTWRYAHILADEYNIRFNKKDNLNYKSNEIEFSRHHVDFNKKNNNPNNIQRLGKKEHFIFHSKNAKESLIRNGNPMWKPETAKKSANTQRVIGHYDKISKNMKSNNPMYNKEISRKVTESKRKNGDYLRLSKSRKVSTPHIKRENLKNWINNLPIGSTLLTKEIVKNLTYFNYSCLGFALRSLVLEDEFKDKLILNKKNKRSKIELIKTDGTNNHKVKSIKLLEEREDVYCLSSPEYSNFAIAADNSDSLNSGIFVHNCDNYFYMWWFGIKKIKAHEGAKYPPYVKVPGSNREPLNPSNIPGMCKHLIYVVKELKRKRKLQ